MKVRLSAEEISTRSPVWVALSQLFLDSYLTDEERLAIAEVIRDAGFFAEEAEIILIDEVAPVFASNLMSVAGEWVPWDEGQVAELILAQLSRRQGLLYNSWIGRWWRRRLLWLIWTDWQTVKRLCTSPAG